MYDRRLSTFIQVVDSGSFAKAAEKLYISSVSIMKQMNVLESEIGARLLDRTSHGVAPTEAGQVFYQCAKEMISFSDASIQKVCAIAEREQYIIRIGSSNLRPCKLLIDKWNEIDVQNLPFQLKIVSFYDESADVEETLKQIGKDFDCFITPCDPRKWEGKYGIYILKKTNYRLGVSRRHPLSRKKVLTWDDLKGETLMLLSPGYSSLVDDIRSEIASSHPDVHVKDVNRSYSTDIFNQCEENNYLLGTLDIWADQHPGLITLPVEWDFGAVYGIVYAKEPPQKFLDFLDVIRQHDNAKKG